MNSIVKKTRNRVTAYFLTGVFAILPLVVTVAVVVWVAGFLHQFVGPGTWLGERLEALGGLFVADQPVDADKASKGPSIEVYLLGWICVLAGIFGLGFVLVELGIRTFVGRIVDAVVSRIPLIGQVYGTSKQLVDMLDKGDEDKLQGMAPVFCYFSSAKNGGVLALLVSPERFNINGKDYQIIIIPTAPVPFGGALLFMPVDLIEPAGMSVDGLMSIYVSMGVTAPQFIGPEAENNPSPSET